MKYEVEFREQATVTRINQVIVEADSKDEVKEKIESGDYEYMDGWDTDDYDAQVIGIESITPIDDDIE